jgi:hypothetical protein
MLKPDLHSMECACRACTPPKLDGGAMVLGIGAVAVLIVSVLLLAFLVGQQIDSLSTYR